MKVITDTILEEMSAAIFTRSIEVSRINAQIIKSNTQNVLDTTSVTIDDSSITDANTSNITPIASKKKRKSKKISEPTKTIPRTYSDGQLHHSERLFHGRIPKSVIIRKDGNA